MSTVETLVERRDLGSGARVRVLIAHESRRAVKSLAPRIVFLALPIVLSMFLQRTFALALSLQGEIGANGSEQTIPGQAILFAFVILVYLGYTAFDDHGWGMWNRLQVGGVRSMEAIGAKASVMAVHELAHLGLVFAAGFAFLHLRIRGSGVALALVIVATALMIVAFGFMAFALSSSNAVYNAFCYVAALIMTAAGGGLVPFDLLPGWARSVAPATPTYWAMQACRQVILGSAGVAGVARHLVALAAFTVGFVLVGLWRFDPDRPKEAFNL